MTGAYTYEVVLVGVYEPGRRMTKLVQASQVDQAVRRAKTSIPNGFTDWQFERAARIGVAEPLAA